MSYPPDPEFDMTVPAFYYVRVLENPVCRWSTRDANRLGMKPLDIVPATIQERIWTSPIWYPRVGQKPPARDIQLKGTVLPSHRPRPNPGWPRIRPVVDSHAVALDTAPEARRLQIEGWAESSPARKAEMVQALCRDARSLGCAGIRLRFPDASPREQRLRLGALTIERRLMIEAFGWDPEREGR